MTPEKTTPLSRWTKKDIRFMCGTLDEFWLLRRPLSSTLSADGSAADAVRELLKTKRQDVVLDGIRSARARCAERRSKSCFTAFWRKGCPTELFNTTQSRGPSD